MKKLMKNGIEIIQLYYKNTLLFIHNYYRLSDKSRFSYDGLKRQRLVTPMLRDSKGELKPVDWEVALLTVAKQLRNAGRILMVI